MKMFGLLEGKCQLEGEKDAGENIWLARGEVLTLGGGGCW